MKDYSTQLLTEAVVVGTALMPVYFFTHSFVTALFPRTSDEVQDYLSLFISGSMFHLLCEVGGVNDWYLDNGVATLKRLEKEEIYEEENMNDPSLCDGRCGWETMGGLCSHYSFHA
jgi:hypothetical protein